MNKRIEYSPPAAEIILLAPCEELAVIEKGVANWYNRFLANDASGGDLGLINAGGGFYEGGFGEEFVVRFPKSSS